MSAPSTATKTRIFASALADMAVDLAVPTLVALALTAGGTSIALALAAGGVLVGAKTFAGPLEQWRLDRRLALAGVAAAAGLLVLFGLPPAGASQAVAAGAAVLVVAVPVLVTVAVRSRRGIDGFGLLVIIELAASIALTLSSEDPRVVLARPAVYTLVAGMYAVATCRWGRPLMLDATKPMAAGGNPVRAAAFEAAWRHSPPFRRLERAMTAGLGAVLIAEAALRVLIVYSSSQPSLAVTGLLAQLPALALALVWFLCARALAIPRARTIVDSFVPRSDGEPSPEVIDK